MPAKGLTFIVSGFLLNQFLQERDALGEDLIGGAGERQELGLTEALKARTKFLDGFPAAEAVARGEVEIALQQINVILPVAGAELGGVLPPELQRYNEFAAGVLATSKEKGVAADMAKFMGAPENAALVRKSGMETPSR